MKENFLKYIVNHVFESGHIEPHKLEEAAIECESFHNREVGRILRELKEASKDGSILDKLDEHLVKYNI